MRREFAMRPFIPIITRASMCSQHALFSIAQRTHILATSSTSPPKCSGELTMSFFRHQFQVAQSIIVLLEIAMVYLICSSYFASQNNVLIQLPMKTDGLPVPWHMKAIISFFLLVQCRTSSSYIAWHVFCYHIVAIAIEPHMEPKSITTAHLDHLYLPLYPIECLPLMLEPTHACTPDDTRNLNVYIEHNQHDQTIFFLILPFFIASTSSVYLLSLSLYFPFLPFSSALPPLFLRFSLALIPHSVFSLIFLLYPFPLLFLCSISFFPFPSSSPSSFPFLPSLLPSFLPSPSPLPSPRFLFPLSFYISTFRLRLRLLAIFLYHFLLFPFPLGAQGVPWGPLGPHGDSLAPPPRWDRDGLL